jgi:hypothetical protein
LDPVAVTFEVAEAMVYILGLGTARSAYLLRLQGSKVVIACAWPVQR